MDYSALSTIIEKVSLWAVQMLPAILLSVGILVVGMWLVKRITRLLINVLDRVGVDKEVSGFMMSLSTIVLKFIVILVAASVLGFQTSSLLGILAGAVFAIGLALQGFLGNFASGITIVFFKPYKVGDWVQISDTFGKVKSIHIFNTTMITPGDKTLIIPNGKVTDSIITNFSSQGRMRLELHVTMPYSEGFPKVKKTIRTALKNFPLILEDPEPLIGMTSFDSHNIVVTVRPYIHPDHYWAATFEALERIKRAFHDANIEVAYSEGVEMGKVGE